MCSHLSVRPARVGFTLVEIMIVVAIIGLLAAIAVPNFVKAREVAQRTGCISNLKAIEGAKGTWALETRHGGTDVPADDDLFGPGRFLAAKPGCPGNGNYTLNPVDTKPACSVASHTL